MINLNSSNYAHISVKLNESENRFSQPPSSCSFNDNTTSDNQAFSEATIIVKRHSEQMQPSQTLTSSTTNASRRPRKSRTEPNPFSNSPGFGVSHQPRSGAEPPPYQQSHSNFAPVRSPPRMNNISGTQLIGLGIQGMSQQHAIHFAEAWPTFENHNGQNGQISMSGPMTGFNIDTSAVVNPSHQDSQNQVGQAVALQQQQLDSMTLPQKLEYFEAQKAANSRVQIIAQQKAQQQCQSQNMLNQIPHQQLIIPSQDQFQAPGHQNHLVNQQIGFLPNFPMAVPNGSQIKFVLTNSQFDQYMSYLREKDARELGLKSHMVRIQRERLTFQRQKAVWEQQQRQQMYYSSGGIQNNSGAHHQSRAVERGQTSSQGPYQYMLESLTGVQQGGVGRSDRAGNFRGNALLRSEDENYQQLYGYLQNGEATATPRLQNNSIQGYDYMHPILSNNHTDTYDHLQNEGVQDNEKLDDEFSSFQPQHPQSLQPLDHDAPVPSMSQLLPLSPSNVHNYHVTPIDSDFSYLDEQIQAQEQLESPSIHLPPAFQSTNLAHSSNQEDPNAPFEPEVSSPEDSPPFFSHTSNPYECLHGKAFDSGALGNGDRGINSSTADKPVPETKRGVNVLESQAKVNLKMQ